MHEAIMPELVGSPSGVVGAQIYRLPALHLKSTANNIMIF
jgi:hypothetical protein